MKKLKINSKFIPRPRGIGELVSWIALAAVAILLVVLIGSRIGKPLDRQAVQVAPLLTPTPVPTATPTPVPTATAKKTTTTATATPKATVNP